MSIESWDSETKTASKNRIFEEDVVRFDTEPTSVEGAHEALNASLGWRSKVDLEWMQKLTGMSLEELLSQLEGKIFLDPDTEEWISSGAYLSGDVLTKLSRARALRVSDSRMQPNIDALEKVLPVPKRVADQTLIPKLGAPYIPVPQIRRFIAHLTGEKPVEVEIGQALDRDGSRMLSVNGERGHTPQATQTWGTQYLNVYEIIAKTLNGKLAFPVKGSQFDVVNRTTGKEEFSEERYNDAMLVAMDVQTRIYREYQKWIKSHPDEAKVLEQAYNDGPNRFVARDWEEEAKHLKLHGAAEHFLSTGGLRDVQRKAITRAVQANTYFVHQTGVGKTFSLIGAAMEAKRRGVVTKGLLVVPTNKIEEFMYQDIRRLYPTAKVTKAQIPRAFWPKASEGKVKSETLDKREKDKEKYIKEMDRLIAFDGDIIIINHLSLSNLRTSLATERQWLFQQRAELAESEHRRRDYLDALLENLKREGEIPGYTFEALAIDWMGVDEAHHFKNTPVESAEGSKIQGLAVKYSKMGANFFDVARYVVRSGGRLVLASATPVPNSPSEVYSVQTVIDPEPLRTAGIRSFDDWMRHYVHTENQLIVDTDNTIKSKPAVVSFENAGNMYTMAYLSMDTATGEGLALPAHDEPEIVVAEPDKAQQAAMDKVTNMIRSGEGSVLGHLSTLIGMTMDARMYDKDAPRNPRGKIDTAANLVAKYYKEMDPFKGVTVVFAERMRTLTEGGNKDFHTHRELKRVLVEDKGIPASQVEVWMDYKNTDELQEKLRRGDVRVLLASTSKGGEGSNYQDRIGVMIHMDQDWTAKNWLQRRGRGIRPGNRVTSEYGWSIKEFNLTLKGSVEQYMFGVIRNKAQMLTTATSGKGDALVDMPAGDPQEGDAVYFKALQQLAAGNSELLKEMTELQTDVRLLSAQKSSWEASVIKWQRAVAEAPGQIESKRQELKIYPEIAEQFRNATIIEFQDSKKNTISKPPSGDGKASVNAAWEERWKQFVAQPLPETEIKQEEKIATVKTPNGDFDVMGAKYRFMAGDTKVSHDLYATINERYTSLNQKGTWKGRLEGAAKSKERLINKIEKEIEEIETNTARQQEELAKPWEHADVFATKRKRLSEIEQEIKDSKENGGADPEVARAMYIKVAPPDGSPAAPAPQTANELDAHIQDIANRIAPGLKTRMVDRIDADPDAAGFYQRGMAQIAMAAAHRAPWILRHEAVHYLLDRGLLLEREWEVAKNLVRRGGWIDKYRIRERYPDFFDEQGNPTEEAYEEAFAYAFAEWAQLNDEFRGLTGTVLRMFQRVRRLLYRLGNRLDDDPETLFREIESGAIGRRSPKPPKGPAKGSYAYAPHITYEDTDREERWQERREGLSQSARFGARMRERVAQVYDGFQRVHKNLPREPRFQQSLEWLRHLSTAPSVSAEESATYISRLVDGLDAADRDLLGRAVFLRDFAEDVRLGIQKIPFFESLDEFQHEFRRVEAELQKPEHFDIRRRLDMRYEVTRDIAERMVDAGLLPEEALKRRGYIMHQVFKYAAEVRTLKPKQGSRLRTPHWYKRMGTWEDINVNLVEVEAAWMQKALTDLRTMETIDKFRESQYNKREEMLEASRTHNEKLVNDRVIAEWVKHDPKSWDPKNKKPALEQFSQMLKAKNAPINKDTGKPKDESLTEYMTAVAKGKRAWIDTEKIGEMKFTMRLLEFREQLGRDFATLRWLVGKARGLGEQFDEVAFPNERVAEQMREMFNVFADPEDRTLTNEHVEDIDPEDLEFMENWQPWEMLRWMANDLKLVRKPVLKDGKFVMSELDVDFVETEDQKLGPEAVVMNMQNAARHLFGQIYTRQTFYKDTFKKSWIHGNDMEEVLTKLKESGYEGLDGYRTWQPDTGRILYTVRTLPERVADTVVEHVDDVAEVWRKHLEDSGHDQDSSGEAPSEPAWIKDRALLRQVRRQLRNSLAVGGPKYQMVLPEEIADTLDQFRDTELEGIIDTWFTAWTNAWKKWVLINPAGLWLYNFRNTSGDLDHTIANFGLKGVKNMKPHIVEAVRQLWRIQYGSEPQTDAYKLARKLGVVDSGFALNEVLEVQNALDGFVDEADVAGKGWNAVKQAWRHMAKITGFRENIFRYAVFTHMLDSVQSKGMALSAKAEPKQIRKLAADVGGLAGIDHDAMEALDNWYEIAAHVSRETLGDYGNLSQSGKFIRSTLYPFWSWTEINIRFYSRVGKNVARKFGKDYKEATGVGNMGAARAAAAAAAGAGPRLLIQSFWLFGFIEVLKLLFSGMEDELPEYAAKSPHIPVWESADNVFTLPTPGALYDFLEIFGLTELRMLMEEVRLGRASLMDIPMTGFYGMTNYFAQGITPAIKIPVEALTGLTFYPDAWNPRNIRDTRYHTLRNLRVDTFADVFGALTNTGRPNLGPINPLKKWFMHVHPKEYSSYSRTRSLAYAYKNQVSENVGRNVGMSEKARVMWYWRLAKRYGDKDAERRYFEEMKRLKVTKAGLQRMIMGQHPIGVLNNKEKREFLAQLTPKEKDDYKRAVRYWRNIFR